MCPSILDLPEELLALVVEYVHDRTTLQHLAHTCRRLQEPAEQELYRSIEIQEVYEAEAICYSIWDRPKRALTIQRLVIMWQPRTWYTTDAIEDLLTKAKNLKELWFGAVARSIDERGDSDWNTKYAEEVEWKRMLHDVFQPLQSASMFVISDRPLQKLQKLTLRLSRHNFELWTLDLQDLMSIFLHPTLQQLTLCRADIVHSALDSVRARFFTPLKQLDLINCNISNRGLYNVLSLPEALESLTLDGDSSGLSVRHKFSSYQHALLHSSAHLALSAIKQQDHSLRFLTYGPCRHLIKDSDPDRNPIDAGFASFSQLQSVTLLGRSPGFERALMRFDAPGTLSEIGLKMHWPLQGHDRLEKLPFLGGPEVQIPEGVKTLHLTYAAIPLAAWDPLGHGLRPAIQRSLIRQAAREAGKLNISLRVSIELLALPGGSDGYSVHCDEPEMYKPDIDGISSPRHDLVFEEFSFIGKHNICDEDLYPEYDHLRRMCGYGLLGTELVTAIDAPYWRERSPPQRISESDIPDAAIF